MYLFIYGVYYMDIDIKVKVKSQTNPHDKKKLTTIG
jgi:hypothetical protein